MYIYILIGWNEGVYIHIYIRSLITGIQLQLKSISSTRYYIVRIPETLTPSEKKRDRKQTNKTNSKTFSSFAPDPCQKMPKRINETLF